LCVFTQELPFGVGVVGGLDVDSERPHVDGLASSNLLELVVGDVPAAGPVLFLGDSDALVRAVKDRASPFENRCLALAVDGMGTVAGAATATVSKGSDEARDGEGILGAIREQNQRSKVNKWK